MVAFAFSWETDTLETLENLTIDARHRLSPDATGDPCAVVVGINDSSLDIATIAAPRELQHDPVLAAMGRSWPWDRRVFAAVVRKLRAAGARAIVFDFVFESTTAGDPEFIQALAEPGAPVVLAGLFQEEHSLEGEGMVPLKEPRLDFLARPRVSMGFANVYPDDDGLIRQTILATSAKRVKEGWTPPAPGEAVTPSLAAATAKALGVSGLPAGGYIEFRGPPERFPSVPVENLFFEDRWKGAVIERGALFRDRVVLVGPRSEITFKDYYATPLGWMAGVELQAHIIAGLLGDGLLRRAPHEVSVLAVVALAALAATLGVALRRATWQIAGVGLVAGVWTGVAWVAFAQARYILPVAAPLGALLSTGAVALGLRYIGEQRERRRVRRLLSSYVSEEVARVIVRQPEAFESALRGDRRPVTVLFADIRNFTSLAEHAAPGAFIAQLNEYLHPVVDCVLVAEGTLQKFIGDAILAVWGDTHTAGEKGDAVRAVSAALAIEQTIVRLNAGWANQPDRPPLRIGVGLHQGPAMVGNIGHPRRMEFAVLGDTVNLASRLEGANRFFGTTVLVGDTVHALAADEFHFIPVARVVVKGRSQPVEVFAPFSPRSEVAPAWFTDYMAALGCCRPVGLPRPPPRLPHYPPRTHASVRSFPIRNNSPRASQSHHLPDGMAHCISNKNENISFGPPRARLGTFAPVRLRPDGWRGPACPTRTVRRHRDRQRRPAHHGPEDDSGGAP